MAPHLIRRLRLGVAIAAAAVVVAGGAVPALAAPGQDGPGHGPGQPDVDRRRIAALVGQMTVPEKSGMRGGTTGANGAACAIAGVPRLGVPGLDMADGPSGVWTPDPATS